jgi:hypothetical protein
MAAYGEILMAAVRRQVRRQLGTAQSASGECQYPLDMAPVEDPECLHVATRGEKQLRVATGVMIAHLPQIRLPCMFRG